MQVPVGYSASCLHGPSSKSRDAVILGTGLGDAIEEPGLAIFTYSVLVAIIK